MTRKKDTRKRFAIPNLFRLKIWSHIPIQVPETVFEIWEVAEGKYCGKFRGTWDYALGEFHWCAENFETITPEDDISALGIKHYEARRPMCDLDFALVRQILKDRPHSREEIVNVHIFGNDVDSQLLNVIGGLCRVSVSLCNLGLDTRLSSGETRLALGVYTFELTSEYQTDQACWNRFEIVFLV
jgi:hypothetical protein